MFPCGAYTDLPHALSDDMLTSTLPEDINHPFIVLKMLYISLGHYYILTKNDAFTKKNDSETQNSLFLDFPSQEQVSHIFLISADYIDLVPTDFSLNQSVCWHNQSS